MWYHSTVMRTFSAPARDINFQIVDELDSVMQRVAQRLQFRLGEWFLRRDRGTNYEPILGEIGVNVLGIQAFTAEAASVEDVLDVTDVSYRLNNETRILSYEANIHTPYGTRRLSLEIS